MGSRSHALKITEVISGKSMFRRLTSLAVDTCHLSSFKVSLPSPPLVLLKNKMFDRGSIFYSQPAQFCIFGALLPAGVFCFELV